MSITVFRTAEFAKELRSLKKKYPQAVEDLKELLNAFQTLGEYTVIESPMLTNLFTRCGCAIHRRGEAKEADSVSLYLVVNPR